jgi:hypothetical protein
MSSGCLGPVVHQAFQRWTSGSGDQEEGFIEGISENEATELDDYPDSSSPPGSPVIYHRYWKLGIEEVREWEGLY